jgi:hypothetical protein
VWALAHTGLAHATMKWAMRPMVAPVESQKGATVPVVSATGLELKPNTHPLVPRDNTSTPSLTAPAPNADIMLSPPPGATTVDCGRLYRIAAAGVSCVAAE